MQHVHVHEHVQLYIILYVYIIIITLNVYSDDQLTTRIPSPQSWRSR